MLYPCIPQRQFEGLKALLVPSDAVCQEEVSQESHLAQEGVFLHYNSVLYPCFFGIWAAVSQISRLPAERLRPEQGCEIAESQQSPSPPGMYTSRA